MLTAKNTCYGEQIKWNLKNIRVLTPSLQNSIQKVIVDEGYVTCKIETRSLNTGGNNFMGDLYEVDIKGETAECAKETNIFIKQKVVFNKIKAISVDDSFKRELFVYNDLSQIFARLQDVACVPPGDRFKIAKAYVGTDENAIILENLTKRNFKIYDKLDIMPLKYAQLAVEELAKFHGLSFVIEDRMPDYFNNKIKTLPHALNYDDDWKKLMRKICTHLANLYDNEVKMKIEKFIPILLDKFPKYGEQKTSVKCSLTHEDYKINNVLVREHNGEPVEIIPVDYQQVDYGCPIRDFIFFIFSGTDRKFRQQHLNDLKDLYFETLSGFLKYFDMDVEAVYPRREFETVYTEWLVYGLMAVLFASVFMFAPPTGFDIENLRICDFPYCPDKVVEERLKELIEDFIEWGYL